MKTKMILVIFWCLSFSLVAYAFDKKEQSDTSLSSKGRLYEHRVSLFQVPQRVYLKGWEESNEERIFTIQDLKTSNRLIGIKKGKQFQIKQFWCSIVPGGFIHDNRFPTAEKSPVFKADSFSREYLRYLESLPDGINISLNGVHFLSPDSVEIICNNLGFGKLVKDSSSLIIAKYGGYERTHSVIRVKISGNPSASDLKTIDRIIEELNSCMPTLGIKQVKLFPSVVINFDSISPSLDNYSTIPNMGSDNCNLFFPKLSNSSIGINYNIYNQRLRDSILWRFLPRTLFLPSSNELSPSQNSLFKGRNSKLELTYEDKLALKTIFSRSSAAKINQIWNISTKIPSVSFIFSILLSILFFLILNEISSFYGFSRVFKHISIYYGMCALLYVQFIILAMQIADSNAFEKNKVIQFEMYFISYAIILSQLFLTADLIAKKMKYKWQRIALNPILSLISLYVAYQIIYLFVRCEILQFETIDTNAITIAASVIIIRFFVDYQELKLSSLMQEKEYELTKHRELQSRAELNALQARINPHFLYNALNSIAALAHIDSTRTENMALSLSKLFRYNVNREEQVVTTLGQEIEMVQLYLDIEKQRFGERLNFSIIANSELYEKQIPRFLIQPLIENAIKHGISKVTEKGVVVLKVYENKEKLVIEVYDNGPAFPEGINSGYGLQNTYEKLNIVHQKPYDVKFINTPEKLIQITL